MRHRFIGGMLAATAAVGLCGSPAHADGSTSGTWPVAGMTEPTFPIPTGQAGSAGFYTGVEFVMLTQTRTLGNQIVAYRGFVDSTGNITGLPGIYVGSSQPAFTTSQLGRTSFQPGAKIELGYKFENGLQIYANYLTLADQGYTVGASLATPYFRSAPDLSDTFLVSQVSNFPTAFAGPTVDTAYDQVPGQGGGNTYGIWNAADVMNIKYTTRYSQAEAGARMPIFQTDYSRVYGMAGGRFAWFFERFQWYTLDLDVAGNGGPNSQAFYTNTLSQRMYGPFIGTGHEVFLHNQFSASVDLTAAALLNVIKERAKYKLGDVPGNGVAQPVASKSSHNEFSIVPNFNASANLWWYPIEGVQVRVGYTAMTYFNTRGMTEPIGFNYSNPDPKYNVQYFRLVHGVDVGIGFFF